jgi:transposase InsO family protein
MPWLEQSTMSLRSEFVALARQDDRVLADLCRRFGISRKSGYKWLARSMSRDASPLVDRSRRPHTAPARTAAAIESQVLALRDTHPAWGGRKLRARLLALGVVAVPSASTMTAILRRHDRLDPATALQHRAFIRFEHATPNALWQLDFKGEVPLVGSGWCHPLTVLDDHSRFLLGLAACGNEQRLTVQDQLTTLFRRYGLPERILCDNGAPWGTTGSGARYSQLGVWLLQLGIGLSHGRPYHPQTQGKDERLHRSLKAEVLRQHRFADLAAAQRAFDRWRTIYNEERPHDALALAVPASRYQLSPRLFPETLPPIEYAPHDLVRHVQTKGYISFQGRHYDLSTAFAGQPVAVRPTATDGVWTVYFLQHEIAQLDQRLAIPQ